MDSLTVGAIVCACAFGGALLGMLASALLPKHHLSTESKDVIKVAMAMMATLSALVVSLLISTAKTSFDEKDSELREQSARVIMLDRLLAQYGPETQGSREILRAMTEEKLRAIWGGEAEMEQRNEIDSNVLRSQDSSIEGLQSRLHDLKPKDEKQRSLKEKTLHITFQIEEGRWRLLEQLDGRIQWPFLAMLVFWLTIVFISFGMFAPRNMSVIAALFICSLSVAGAIYMIVEMDEPYGGFIKISSKPVKAALDQLGR